MTDYNHAIRLVRVANNMTQKHLAEEAGVSLQTISAIECGRRLVETEEEVVHYANALGCKVTTLDLLALPPDEREEDGDANEGVLGALLDDIGAYDVDEEEETEETEEEED